MLEAVNAIKSPGMNGVEPTAPPPGSGGSLLKKEAAFAAKARDSAKKVQQESLKKVEQIAESMNNYVKSVQRELKIGVHQDTGEIIVRVISEENGKVIREIPPEELLNLASKMEEMLGVLFNENA